MSAVVTQADREVLKAIYAPAAHEAIDAGDYDSHQDAQAIARHRSEAVEELVEVLGPFALMAEVAEEHGHGPGSSCEWRMSYDDFAAARALVAKHRGEQG